MPSSSSSALPAYPKDHPRHISPANTRTKSVLSGSGLYGYKHDANYDTEDRYSRYEPITQRRASTTEKTPTKIPYRSSEITRCSEISRIVSGKVATAVTGGPGISNRSSKVSKNESGADAAAVLTVRSGDSVASGAGSGLFSRGYTTYQEEQPVRISDSQEENLSMEDNPGDEIKIERSNSTMSMGYGKIDVAATSNELRKIRQLKETPSANSILQDLEAEVQSPSKHNNNIQQEPESVPVIKKISIMKDPPTPPQTEKSVSVADLPDSYADPYDDSYHDIAPKLMPHLSRRVKIILLVVSLCLLALILGLSFGLRPAKIPTTIDFTEFHDDSPGLRRYIVDIIRRSTISDKNDLESPATPQGMSVQWIINQMGASEVSSIRRDALVQRYVLGVLHYATSGDLGWERYNSTTYDVYPPGDGPERVWMTYGHECAWEGVNCTGAPLDWDKEDNLRWGIVGRKNEDWKDLVVKDVDLPQMNLIGTIPPEICHLVHLTSLNLEENDLEGTIPSSLSKLSNLEHLSLAFNELTGHIPNSFFSLRKMLYLYLNNNNLGGTLPAYWGREYESLSVGWLHNNNFIGSVPKEWGTLKYLVELSLQNNNLKGSMPNSVCNLSTAANTTGSEWFLEADCLAGVNAAPAIECFCCTLCCNSTVCHVYSFGS